MFLLRPAAVAVATASLGAMAYHFQKHRRRLLRASEAGDLLPPAQQNLQLDAVLSSERQPVLAAAAAGAAAAVHGSDPARIREELAKHKELRREHTETSTELQTVKKNDQLLKKQKTNAHTQSPTSPQLEVHPNVVQPASNLIEIAAGLCSEDVGSQLAAAVGARKMLSEQKSLLIQYFIDRNLVAPLVCLLDADDRPDIQLEAACALTIIASGTSDQTRAVMCAGAGSKFIRLLSMSHPAVFKQAVCAIGNIAGDGPELCDALIADGVVLPLISLITPDASDQLVQKVLWTLCNLCRNVNPPPPESVVRQCLPVMWLLLGRSDPGVRCDTCWAFCYQTDESSERIHIVLDAGVVLRLVELLYSDSSSVISPALRSVRDIVMGTDLHTQLVIDAPGALQAFHALLCQEKASIQNDAAWTLSNVTAGNIKQIQAVIDALIPKVINVIQKGDNSTKREAAWVVANLTTGGDVQQVNHIVECCALPHLCDLLLVSDSNVVLVVLDALKNMLRAAGTIGAQIRICEKAGGLAKLEALQQHGNVEIHNEMITLIGTYSSDYDNDEDGSVAPAITERLKEEASTSSLNSANSQVNSVVGKGEVLHTLAGDAAKPEIGSVLTDVRNDYAEDELEGAMEQVKKFQQDFLALVGWLTRAEKTLATLPPVGRVVGTVSAQRKEHRALQEDIAAMQEAVTALVRTGRHLKNQDVTLMQILQLWERVLALVADRSRQLDAGWREAKSCHEQWTGLCRWLEESERQIEAAAAAAGAAAALGADPARIRDELAKHKEFQRLLGSTQPSYDAVCRFCEELKEQLGSSGGGVAGAAIVESDGHVIDTMLSTLKAAWVSVCGKSVDRQRQLEEALQISEQFRGALRDLLDWLCRVEPMFGDDKCVHGDVDTVRRLVDEHEVFMQLLVKHGQTLQSVRKTAKDIVEQSSLSGANAASEIQAQIVELNASWDKVGRLADKRKEQLDEALAVAEDFSRRTLVFVDWVRDNQGLLRYYGDIADDEQGVRQQLDAHRIKYKEEIESQRTELHNTLRIGEAILSQCHQDAVLIMKQWLTILNTQFEKVITWCQQKEERLEEELDRLHCTSEPIDELLGWLIGVEGALVAMANNTLPLDPDKLKDMMLEHDDFASKMSARQSDYNMLVKEVTQAADGRASSLGNLVTTPGGSMGSSDRITSSRRCSMRADQPGARLKSAATLGEPTIRNPKVQALSLKWRQVWLMVIDRRRLLQDTLELQLKRARHRKINFKDWRRRFMAWMNDDNTRVVYFFRRMDKDRDGKVTRQEFISGIMQSKFLTSELELEAVANIFDVTGEGYIDCREFTAALRGEGEKEADTKRTEAECIADEVARQCCRCCCVKRYEIQKIADNKYTFGDAQKLCLVRILRSTVMVRVGGGWVKLDEFLVKNDPCRANSHSLSVSRASSRGATSDDGIISHTGSSSSSVPQSLQQQPMPHTPLSASRLPVPTCSSSSRIPVVRSTPRTGRFTCIHKSR